jgi:hypothetical protein
MEPKFFCLLLLASGITAGQFSSDNYSNLRFSACLILGCVNVVLNHASRKVIHIFPAMCLTFLVIKASIPGEIHIRRLHGEMARVQTAPISAQMAQMPHFMYDTLLLDFWQCVFSGSKPKGNDSILQSPVAARVVVRLHHNPSVSTSWVTSINPALVFFNWVETIFSSYGSVQDLVSLL